MATQVARQELKRSGSVSDPLWYKDAIIYEVHVRTYMDSNNDGIGDLAGLTEKLDYIQDLGVTCIWLLPFFPSPLRDDGYDISDYMGVHPSYGTVDDFKKLLDEAHRRGLQVLIELVINHTSDQHPWFQRARRAPKGSPERDFYVWSDTDEKYTDVRIIFTDTEKSNWTWDAEAQAYYWHRFFSHQPDLNYDNPLVLEEVLKVMRHWLDMGVDGLRLDAIPYLVERDGTSSENLPETHAIIRRIRAAIDQEYFGRMILAEANQWPEDVRPYFGVGDECHMAFHFPLMPRIYMALRQEDRLPITDIMAQTPGIPEICQWALFLRNHDELTLEMVSDDERDYMYMAYSADPRMRINIGIRRRLAPLLDNNRRRIELLNSILFSFPGTPVVYYGDEIGMGDNIYLGDRNGVRTPMQWSGDRNAGFSRAVPAKLYSPVVMDPVWGYEAVNVEAQQSDPSSLLNWMRNMIALRKLFQVFGRGTITFLNATNRKVLAYLREYDSERVLCVANLSRFHQPVELDLSAYAGMRPVEMLGYVEFPRITKQPYPLTLGPYGFLWLEMQPATEGASVMTEEPRIGVAGPNDWVGVLEGAGRRELEEAVLKDYLPRQRWFGGKSRTIATTSISDWAVFNEGNSALVIAEVGYTAGDPETYLMALNMLFGREAEEFRDANPGAVLASVSSLEEDGVLRDALCHHGSCEALLELIAGSRSIGSRKGTFAGSASSAYPDLRGEETVSLVPRKASVEQSNTSVIFGDRLILKLFRRQQPGVNPDMEIGRYFTEDAHYPYTAPFGGAIAYSSEGRDSSTVAMLQGLVPNEGDGWKWTLDELGRYYETVAARSLPPELTDEPHPDWESSWDRGMDWGSVLQTAEDGSCSEASAASVSEPGRGSPVEGFAHDHIGMYLNAASLLGVRTAEMHLALAGLSWEPGSDALGTSRSAMDPAFAPEPLTPTDLLEISDDLRGRAGGVLDSLKGNLSYLPDSAVELAGIVLGRRSALLDRFHELSASGGVTRSLRTRIHGDFHLGQVLRSKGDFVILDFEGEPARPLQERRKKYSPLKDVAGMIRSFSYAALSALMQYSSRRPGDFKQIEPWARLWEKSVSLAFLCAYAQRARGSGLVPAEPQAFARLLEAYLLDKALYELMYELNNRPSWVRIPLAGILSLTTAG